MLGRRALAFAVALAIGPAILSAHDAAAQDGRVVVQPIPRLDPTMPGTALDIPATGRVTVEPMRRPDPVRERYPFGKPRLPDTEDEFFYPNRPYVLVPVPIDPEIGQPIRPSPGTAAWYDYCSAKYRSFDRSTGMFTNYHGQKRLCR